MKKQIVAVALVTTLAMATTASANWGRGDRGCGPCPQGQYQQLDQATKDKVKQFFKDNESLRKEMAMKRAEKKALMRGDNPNPDVVAKVTGELFDLRSEMRDKAEAAGVSEYVKPGRMGGGGGHQKGRGYGKIQ